MSKVTIQLRWKGRSELDEIVDIESSETPKKIVSLVNSGKMKISPARNTDLEISKQTARIDKDGSFTVECT